MANESAAKNGLARIAAVVGLVGFGLGVSGSLVGVGAAQGARDARIAVLEETSKAEKADHDDVISLKVLVPEINRRLGEINARLGAIEQKQK